MVGLDALSLVISAEPDRARALPGLHGDFINVGDQSQCHLFPVHLVPSSIVTT